MLIALLCLSLWGCGMVNPKPPQAAVTAAIAQKVAQTQALLQTQLASPAAVETFQVSQVKIADHHWLTIAEQPAVLVQGTYKLQGGGLARSQQRQARPFEIYLRRGDTKDQWQPLDPGSTTPDQTPNPGF